MLSGRGKIAGVIGWPVSHSLSPRLHNYWLAKHNIDGAYIPLAVTPNDLAGVLKALPKMGLCGVNLTIPHKESVITMLDEVDDIARVIGAVNTVIVNKDGGLEGVNTDVYGFIENLKSHLPKTKHKAVMLGAGGAAKAVCYGLIREGFSEIVIVNRSPEKAEKLAQQFDGRIVVKSWDKRSSALEDADLLVNATSLGLKDKEPLEIDLAALPKKALVTDIVYVPLMTKFLESARARGNPVVDGLGMLIHQAVPGFEAWFGMRPQVTPELRQYLLGE